MSTRPAIPADLERALMIEAGHRCAIPTCRAVGPLQIEHIDDWAKVQKHDFHNMIVLCANCHGRKGSRRGEIDRKSFRQYKANLAIVNSRYGEYERRVLDYFSVHNRLSGIREKTRVAIKRWEQKFERVTVDSETDDIAAMEKFMESTKELNEGMDELVEMTSKIKVSAGLSFALSYLIQDGHLERNDRDPDSLVMNGIRVIEIYQLTDAGKEFISRWKTAKPLDG